MPARRRRTLSRSSAQRTELWNRKVKGDIYALQLPAVKKLALDRVAMYQATHEYLIDLVRNIVGQIGSEPHLIQEYMWYAQKLWSFTQKYSSKALQIQADALFLWYLARGRDELTLRTIAYSLGIKISKTEDILGKIGRVAILSKVAEGTLEANGSEQTVMEYIGLTEIGGYIDLSNMTDGDEVRIKIYVKIKEDGKYATLIDETFSDKQPKPAVYIVPKLSGYAFKVTLQQTKGTYKTFDYFFAQKG